MNLPSRITIQDGLLVMKDGSDLTEYLKKWQIAQCIENGADISIADRDSLNAELIYGSAA